MTGPEHCKQVETLLIQRCNAVRVYCPAGFHPIPKPPGQAPLTAGPRTAINRCQRTLRNGSGKKIVDW